MSEHEPVQPAPPPPASLPPESLPPAPVNMPQFEQAAPPAKPVAPVAKPAPQHFGAGVCPRCGSQDFSKGALLTYGTRFRPAYYKPARLSLFRLHNMLRPFRRLVEVEAQACRSCGLVLFQIDPARLAKIDK